MTASFGNPAAAVDRDGRIRVSVRGSDTYVHVTAQKAPGSSVYRQWSVLEDARIGMRWPSDTDTTMLSTQGGDVLITFRDSGEVPYFFQTEAVAPEAISARAAITTPAEVGYVGGPVRR